MMHTRNKKRESLDLEMEDDIYENEADDILETNSNSNQDTIQGAGDTGDQTNSEAEDESSRKRPFPKENGNAQGELLDLEKKKLKLMQDQVKANKDLKTEDYHFMMSLLTELEKLPTVQKLKFRAKVTSALAEEMESYERKLIEQITEQDPANIPIDIKDEPM